jgi:hypothetical protein
MDLTINRTDEQWDGVFGHIPELNLVTLEHAYSRGDGSFHAKVPQGRYKCVRGQHTLPNGHKLETFEVTHVPGHTGILFHPGNKYQDSAGCFLPGMEVVRGDRQRLIAQSLIALHILLDAQEGVDEFFLTVNGPVTHNT